MTMLPVIIDRKDAALALSGDVLEIRLPDAKPQRLPAYLLDRLVLRADINLSVSLLTKLAELGVGVQLQGGRSGQRVASVIGAPGNDARRRIAQVRQLDAVDFCAGWARRLIDAKLRAQQRLLVQAMRERPELRKPLWDARNTVLTCRTTLHATADVDALRGLEGAAAAAYFPAFARLFPESLGFSARRRRPPPDPVNACLSLGYVMLQGLVVEAIHGVGLDPMIGYLHGLDHGRPSLACDLMEPWRPWVDAMVWQLFRNQTLEAAHFGVEGSGACLLGKAGRSHFYRHWANQCRPLQRAVRRQAWLAVRAISGASP